jgi:hypothetical protein
MAVNVSNEPGIAPSTNNQPATTYASTINGASSDSLLNGYAFSRRIAEYFVAQQAYLIENNEREALSPQALHAKIEELLGYDPSFSDVYFLKYLNYLRLKDYPSALKALHDYFDRFVYSCSISYAPLNLCSLEYRFDNKLILFFRFYLNKVKYFYLYFNLLFK